MTTTTSSALVTGAWRKSSRSNGNGGNCVEVRATTWRKSSRSSGGGNTQCVEAAACARCTSPEIALRDSKLADDPDYPVLTLPAADWAGLIDAIRADSL